MTMISPPGDTGERRAATCEQVPDLGGTTSPAGHSTPRFTGPAWLDTPPPAKGAGARHGRSRLHRPDDGILDPLAVERRAAGAAVPCTTPELAAAARRLHSAGAGVSAISRRLRISGAQAAKYVAAPPEQYAPARNADALRYARARLLAELDAERRIVAGNARAAREPERRAARRAYWAAWQRCRRARAAA